VPARDFVLAWAEDFLLAGAAFPLLLKRGIASLTSGAEAHLGSSGVNEINPIVEDYFNG